MDLFSSIVTLLEKVVGSSSPQSKESHLRKYFSDFESHRQRQKGEIAADSVETGSTSIYPNLRLLLPGLDRERKAYGLREKTLADAYIRALALDRTCSSSDAAGLLFNRNGADLADCLVPLLKGRCPVRGTLTVTEVNHRLDALGEGSRGVQSELSYLIEHGSPLDHRWVVRIVLRNLQLGHLSGRRILQLYHQSAPALYDTTGDLRHVVQLLEGANVGAETVRSAPAALISNGALIRLGHFIRPMLCQRLELRKVGELIGRHHFWLETKMDGERFQVHKDGERFRYLSRNGIDYSATFGATADQLDGTLTPMLAHLLVESVRSVILDGEMMVFDRRTLRYRNKCDGGADVKALRTGNGELRACFCVYDVLLFNGRVLIDMPYAERARLLGTLLVREQIGFVERCQREQVRDREHLVELLNASIDAQQEGVVLKRDDAPYQPNRRTGGGWYKIKPDYIEGLVVDFDLLIIGGYYNAWRTSINAFIMGTIATGHNEGQEVPLSSKQQQQQQNPHGPHFLSVVKVSMGLTAAQWADLNRSLRPHWKDGKEAEPLCWGRAGPPDVCIDPNASIVLQLKGSELVRSDSYGAGYTIRFPRIVAIRSDKMPDEVCTLSELQGLAGGRRDPLGTDQLDAVELSDDGRRATKLAKRHVTMDDIIGDNGTSGAAPSKASGRGRKKKLTIATIGTMFGQGDGDGVLRGRDICVMGGLTESSSIQELEALVRRHGGRAVANPGRDTFAIVVAGAETFKVSKYIASGHWDMVRPDWLRRATGEGRNKSLEPFQPADMLACTDATQLALVESYDRYGDSYTRRVSPVSFTALLRQNVGGPKGGLWPAGPLTVRELVQAERTLLGLASPNRRLFRAQSARLYLPNDMDDRDDADDIGAERGQDEMVLVTHSRARRLMLRFVHHGGRWLRDTEQGTVMYVFVSRRADRPRASISHAQVVRWLRSLERDHEAEPNAEEENPPTVLSTEWIVHSLARSQLADVKEFGFG